jgi:hypothetical protein
MKEQATRIPREATLGGLPEHAAIKTPWEKLISLYDVYHYTTRHNAAMGAGFMEVMRIIIPDYATRCNRLCEAAHRSLQRIFKSPYGKIHADNHNIHPFMKGGMIASLFGDSGDERMLMAGRVCDFGSYRVEKELDSCDWDIVGSECCRVSTYITQGIGECYEGGQSLEFNMVEAKGCGDLHCRIVAENREKYPMPKKEPWQCFGPVATEDQIKYTPEEKMDAEAQPLQRESNYTYRNGLCAEYTLADLYSKKGGAGPATGIDYANALLGEMLAAGEITQEKIDHTIRSVFNYAGKMMFTEFFAAKGLRDWLGVPGDVKDGRILGAYIEVLMQTLLADYKILEFNKEECIYEINLAPVERRFPTLTHAYVSMWYGMSKTLIGSQWSLWREKEGVPETILRIKIAKKIDKFCI